MVEDGWQGVIECKSDGTIEVYYEAEQALPGEDLNEPSEGAVEVEVPGAPTRKLASDVQPASTRPSRKGCIARSTTYDVIALKLTWFSTRVDYTYDRDEIRNVKGQLGWWTRTTRNSVPAFGDWHEDDYGATWGKKVKGNDGTWRRQSLEGWGEFSFDKDDRWPHKHQMVV